MKELQKLESNLNRAKAQLDQLCESDSFTNDDVKTLSPKYVADVRFHQKKYDTYRAKNIEVKETIPVDGISS